MDEKKDLESKKQLVSLIYYRFFNRYLQHVLHVKAGFLKMAVSCLMIETLQSFKEGIEDTSHKSKTMFKNFFASEELRLPGFKEIYPDFYKDIRCGILHQGETTNAWRILRTGKLLDKEEKTINATLFVKALKSSLEHYCDILQNTDFNTKIWENALIKLEDIIKNCKIRQ